MSQSANTQGARSIADLAPHALQDTTVSRTTLHGTDGHQNAEVAVVAAGGWRRLVLGLLVGMIFGALVALVLPRQPSGMELPRARNDHDPHR